MQIEISEKLKRDLERIADQHGYRKLDDFTERIFSEAVDKRLVVVDNEFVSKSLIPVKTNDGRSSFGATTGRFWGI